MPKLTFRAFLIYWIPAAIMLMLIAVESTEYLSSAHTGSLLARVLHFLAIPIPKPVLDLVNEVLRKLGHILGYGFLSFLIFRGCRGTYRALTGYNGWRTARIDGLPVREAFHFLWQPPWALIGWVGAALAATADELHQMTIPSRTGTWWDVLLDSTAALGAQVLIFVIAAHRARRAQETLSLSAGGRLTQVITRD